MRSTTARMLLSGLAATLALVGCSASHTRHSAAGGGGGGGEVHSATTVPTRNPCTLVSLEQARSALGQAVAAAKEAPLGPTCIYTSSAGSQLASVAIQQGQIQQVQEHLSSLHTSASAGHRLFCGTYGRPTLITSLSSTSFLEISAPCAAAEKLAGDALAKLE